MNGARLAKKNALTVRVMAAFAIIRIIVMIINSKHQNGLVPLIILFALFAVGNIVFYLKDDRNELTKFTAISAFAVIVFIDVIVTRSVIDTLPIFVVMGMCMVYMDSFHTLVTCGLSTASALIGAIMSISKYGFVSSVSWVEILLFAIAFTYAIINAANLTISEHETDKQEIEYHIAYQEEITGSMVKVVDNGNAHIELLQNKLDGFQSATEEVTKSVDAISRGVTETAENMEVSTAMTQHIQNIIDNLIDVKDNTIVSTERAIEAVKSGLEIIEGLKNKSADINVANEDVTRVSEELCKKIESAEEITSIIYQISTQTNLLALNASIEAARAGEQGRGFAVVADEIRKLADDTRNSINSITDLLKGVTELANHTSELVGRSVQAVYEQAEYIEAADGSFQSIVGAVDELNNGMKKLDRLSGDLDASNNSIIDGLANQQAASEEIAANAQSSADLCESNLAELEDVIDQLNEVAKIIGSLQNGDIEEMNGVLAETTIEADGPLPDTTDYSAYFDEDEDSAVADESEEIEEEELPDEETSEEESYEEASYEEMTESTEEELIDSEPEYEEELEEESYEELELEVEPEEESYEESESEEELEEESYEEAELEEEPEEESYEELESEEDSEAEESYEEYETEEASEVEDEE